MRQEGVHHRVFTALFVVLVLIAAGADATDDPTQQGRDPAQAVWYATRTRYEGMQTYHQTCTGTVTGPVGEDGVPLLASDDDQRTSELFFKRPVRLRMNTKGLEMISNGTTVWLVDHDRGEYTEGAAPQGLEGLFRLVQSEPRLWDHDSALAILVLFYDPSGSGGAEMERAQNPDIELEAQELNGVPGHRLTFRHLAAVGIESSVWINGETGLIERQESTSPYTFRPVDGSEDIKGVQRSIFECSIVEADTDLDDSLFEFQPSDALVKVDALSTYQEPETAPEMSWDERVAPTVPPLDTSLAPLQPERLELLERSSLPTCTGHSARTAADVDGDHIDELVVASFDGTLVVVDGASGKPSTLSLQGRAQGGTVRQVLPIPTQGGTAWLVVSNHFHESEETGFQQRAVVSLHGTDGDERWVFSPKMPDEAASSRMVAAAGDLNGDGSFEIVVGVSTARHERKRSDTWVRHPQSAVITVLDLAGTRLTQVETSGPIEHMFIGGPAGNRFIVCVSAGEVARFRFRD